MVFYSPHHSPQQEVVSIFQSPYVWSGPITSLAHRTHGEDDADLAAPVSWNAAHGTQLPLCEILKLHRGLMFRHSTQTPANSQH